MEEKISGIVVGGVNFAENDKILNVFTLEKGMISAKIKGVKKAGAKLKFASEPFCFCEFVFSTSLDRRTVIGASLIDSFYPIREDLFKYYSASAVIEYVRRFLKEEIVSPEIFMLTVDSLKELAYGDKDCLNVLLAFLVKSLKLSGYALPLNGCFKCGKQLSERVFFDYSVGGFYCEECKTTYSREIMLSTYQTLEKAYNDGITDGENSLRALKLIDYYLDKKTDEKLNSLKELIKLFKGE